MEAEVGDMCSTAPAALVSFRAVGALSTGGEGTLPFADVTGLEGANERGDEVEVASPVAVFFVAVVPGVLDSVDGKEDLALMCDARV